MTRNTSFEVNTRTVDDGDTPISYETIDMLVNGKKITSLIDDIPPGKGEQYLEAFQRAYKVGRLDEYRLAQQHFFNYQSDSVFGLSDRTE